MSICYFIRKSEVENIPGYNYDLASLRYEKIAFKFNELLTFEKQ
jgi:hypothetical protein